MAEKGLASFIFSIFPNIQRIYSSQKKKEEITQTNDLKTVRLVCNCACLIKCLMISSQAEEKHQRPLGEAFGTEGSLDLVSHHHLEKLTELGEPLAGCGFASWLPQPKPPRYGGKKYQNASFASARH